MNLKIPSSAIRFVSGLPIHRTQTKGGVLYSSAYVRLISDLRSPDDDRAHKDLAEVTQRFGISFHPLIDISYLQQNEQSLVGQNTMEKYFNERRFWSLSSSPYIDVQGFLLSGNWNKRTHPLVQIVRRTDRERWWNIKLMAIDSSSENMSVAIPAACGFLLAKNGNQVKEFEFTQLCEELKHRAISTDFKSIAVGNGVISVGK